jgi:hypothetical protein
MAMLLHELCRGDSVERHAVLLGLPSQIMTVRIQLVWKLSRRLEMYSTICLVVPPGISERALVRLWSVQRSEHGSD